MPPNRFESEVESFLEGSHGDRTHIKRAGHHTVTPLCGTLLDAIHAWVYTVECAERVDSPYWPAYAALGYDRNGRLLELLAALQEDGSILIYHAMTPPSKKMMTEIFGPERRGQ